MPLHPKLNHRLSIKEIEKNNISKITFNEFEFAQVNTGWYQKQNQV